MYLFKLANEKISILLDPEQGAGIRSFFIKKDRSWISLMPDTCDKYSELKAAVFLMIPYSNRIENGVFSFEGREYKLANGENHSLHGDTRSRKWIIERTSENSVVCLFNSEKHENVNWPWQFKARVEYILKENIFSSHLSLWNLGYSNMPAGFGWHPYFNRKLTRDDEPVKLCMQTSGAYPDANDNRIPSGPSQPLTKEQDYSIEKSIQPKDFIDTCYKGYNGNGYILWPESEIKVTYKCSSTCTHLIIFNPFRKYFAIEPVTNANNGVNLYARGEPDSGIISLPPGKELKAEFSLKIDI